MVKNAKVTERRIAKRIKKFDLLALLQLLRHLGYEDDQILFKSVCSNCSQPSLIQDIQFDVLPRKQATIWLHWGMLSAQTPLPTYLLKVVQSRAIDVQAFVDFVNFFDHLLIRNFTRAAFAETGFDENSGWDSLKRCFFVLGGVRSVSTMHWLFSLIYPETGVRVRRAEIGRKIVSGGLRLGFTQLGDHGTLGTANRVPTRGFVVELFVDEEDTPTGRPWAEEARRRFDEHIRPHAGNMNLSLQVFLIVREQSSWARLQQQSFLGYDNVQGGEEREQRISVFRGRVDTE